MEKYHKAVDTINKHYMNENYDAYENAIERYAKALGVSESWLEDLATDARILGWDRD